ncbi:hypothetical protein VFPPC_16419 [Pochonia chlamydosporia 170]|uniref:Uncharacterized protein n=1 Tax=Pochonia chlamydosporia 170 TaxID=1380566 RepID=A0A179FD77_METCM|nr:hypothetical protein VFPPC_16419 [Pochonia chlamydosporia 170]OAQ63059.1 hypothetical protein VFPPC_16419 [Pochonia chlamydosporia 170]
MSSIRPPPPARIAVFNRALCSAGSPRNWPHQRNGDAVSRGGTKEPVFCETFEVARSGTCRIANLEFQHPCLLTSVQANVAEGSDISWTRCEANTLSYKTLDRGCFQCMVLAVICNLRHCVGA